MLRELLCLLIPIVALPSPAGGLPMEMPSRRIMMPYTVPEGAPAEVAVDCFWRPSGSADWSPARVTPFTSETGLRLAPQAERDAWGKAGRIIECNAAGLERTVLFNTLTAAGNETNSEVEFRCVVSAPDGKTLGEAIERSTVDLTGVVVLNDWTKVLQHDEVAEGGEGEGWHWRKDLPPDMAALGNDGLFGSSDGKHALTQLTYPLDLSGWYAIYIATASGQSGIRLRLSGDERADTVSSRFAGQEVFWRSAKMDRQNLVLMQPFDYTGYVNTHIDYIKLVPLSESEVEGLESASRPAPNRMVAGYWEPYSWAFVENVQSPLQHREPLLAFKEAGIALVDTQIGRFGDKVVYESRKSDPLLYGTIGDPIGNIAQPKTNNVGRMQQYTNTLETELRYAHDLGLNLHANFGASACYRGTPLQADISKEHPDWVRGDQLRFEVPEVRAYVLKLFREALDIGAEGISIDFCRYPEVLDTPETGNLFLRELKQLREEYPGASRPHAPLLVRFPGTGVRLSEKYDYVSWVKEGLIDYLVPSNIQGRHMNIDMTPYLAAVKDSAVKLLPCMDGLSWGLEMPHMFLYRAKQLYDQGCEGLYIYQADGRILGWPEDRRTMRMLGNAEAINTWWNIDSAARPMRSKGIFITPPQEFGKYHGWERLRAWTEGIPLGPVEFLIDGQLVHRREAPPYVLGSEENTDDGIIPAGAHTLTIRAQDGEGWLVQSFPITGA